MVLKLPIHVLLTLISYKRDPTRHLQLLPDKKLYMWLLADPFNVNIGDLITMAKRVGTIRNFSLHLEVDFKIYFFSDHADQFYLKRTKVVGKLRRKKIIPAIRSYETRSDNTRFSCR